MVRSRIEEAAPTGRYNLQRIMILDDGGRAASAGGGRVNVYLGDGSYAPNLDVEVYHWTCTSLFVYLNLTPRRSLVPAAAVPAAVPCRHHFARP